MTTNQKLRKLAGEAKQVPLPKRLESVPKTQRLFIDDHDGMGTRHIPVGNLCHEAAFAMRELLDRIDRLEAENEAQRKLMEQAQAVLLQHHSDPGYREARIAALVAITDHLKGPK